METDLELGLIENSVRIIIESPVFRSSKQCQGLLRYIVDHSLADEDALLRERVIGTAVFGREPNRQGCGRSCFHLTTVPLRWLRRVHRWSRN